MVAKACDGVRILTYGLWHELRRSWFAALGRLKRLGCGGRGPSFSTALAQAQRIDCQELEDSTVLQYLHGVNAAISDSQPKLVVPAILDPFFEE